MITGSNTNIRHGGRLFHVQTEDSGRRNPHVISHLYSAGTILASEKTDYSDLLDLESETLAKDVRALIEEQHKEMLRRLKRGDYDSVIAQRIGGESPGSSGTEPTPPAGTARETVPSLEAAPSPDAESAPSAVDFATAEPLPAGRAFGDGIVSKKPLDEVILEYLVEKSRTADPDRERPPPERPPRKE